MKVIFILLVLILALFCIIFSMTECIKNQKKENQNLKKQNSQLKQNIAYLVKHAQEIAQIEKEKEKTFHRIEEARSDEEISEIVNVIVALNNDRVQDNSSKPGNHSSASAPAVRN